MQIILLVNLGSPNQLTLPSIRMFLRKFLSDKRVVGLPRILWYPVLYGIILPFRASRLLKQYCYIWLNGKSPLIYYTEQQQAMLEQKFKNEKIIVHAFSYAKPDINDVLIRLHCQYNITDLMVIPLYPQFSSATTSPVFDQVADFYSDKKYLPQLKFVSDFHNNDYYIAAIANSIERHFVKYGKPQRLVFSYHSLPVKIIQAGDKYFEQCLATTALIVNKLNLNQGDYIITFQSRFGRGKWISPTTAATMMDLAKSGINHIAVVCPGFISDCLETLEEIDVINRDIFMDNGGEQYYYISCLNGSEQCIDLLYQLVKE